VPVSVAVYAAFALLLLLSARYSAACSLLGLAIYGASAFVCYCALHAHVFEGRLRAAERASVSELLAKVVPAKVLLAVLDPDLVDVVTWLSWVSLLTFLRIVARLVRLRLADIVSRPE
jgi:hypothetical protein